MPSHLRGVESPTEYQYHNPHAERGRREMTSYWLVHGTSEEVYNILVDPTEFTYWWSDVYSEVVEVDDNGKTIYEMKTGGWLPHTYQLKTTEKTPSRRIEREVHGDLVGRSVWTIEDDLDNPWSHIMHKWLVRGNNPALKALFWISKSSYISLYKRAMETGKESLQEELNHRSTEHRTLPEPSNEGQHVND